MNLSSRPIRAGAGALAVGMAIAVSSFSMVRAEHAKPDKSKTYTCSVGSACLEGNSTNIGTFGLYGVSTGTGVVGRTTSGSGNSGVAGINDGITGQGLGVYGSSSNGQGVYGVSSAGGSAGVAGYQLGTGTGADGMAIYAESAAVAGTFPVIQAVGDNAQTFLFNVYNVANQTGCDISPQGYLACSGGGELKTVRTRHMTSRGQRVLAYAAESASATLEDVGTARMAGGVATVAIDPDFGATIDRTMYHVFLTPDGDASLYVAQKTPEGFVVRETHGGRSTLEFDYRIIARPIDAMHDRLPAAPAMTKPHILRSHAR
jgi:hypothetical protein